MTISVVADVLNIGAFVFAEYFSSSSTRKIFKWYRVAACRGTARVASRQVAVRVCYDRMGATTTRQKIAVPRVIGWIFESFRGSLKASGTVCFRGFLRKRNTVGSIALEYAKVSTYH